MKKVSPPEVVRRDGRLAKKNFNQNSFFSSSLCVFKDLRKLRHCLQIKKISLFIFFVRDTAKTTTTTRVFMTKSFHGLAKEDNLEEKIFIVFMEIYRHLERDG